MLKPQRAEDACFVERATSACAGSTQRLRRPAGLLPNLSLFEACAGRGHAAHLTPEPSEKPVGLAGRSSTMPTSAEQIRAYRGEFVAKGEVERNQSV